MFMGSRRWRGGFGMDVNDGVRSSLMDDWMVRGGAELVVVGLGIVFVLGHSRVSTPPWSRIEWTSQVAAAEAFGNIAKTDGFQLHIFQYNGLSRWRAAGKSHCWLDI